MVLHADSRLTPGAVRKAFEAVHRCPDAAGGAMEARYDSASLRFRVTAPLNNLRARLLGIAFGDQAQFYRTSAVPQGFPEFRLMEDIELSLRLKERGATLFIPRGVVSSTRRWNAVGFAKNIFMVSAYRRIPFPSGIQTHSRQRRMVLPALLWKESLRGYPSSSLPGFRCREPRKPALPRWPGRERRTGLPRPVNRNRSNCWRNGVPCGIHRS